jgi:predicted dehydrogenase
MKKGGIIGFGGMGQQFARFVQEHPELDAEIIGACNRGKTNLKIASDEFGLYTTHDVDDLLSKDLDFVLIATQSNTHADYVVAAAEAGCDIFCEKPIALSLADADRMIDAVDRAGVITSVNYIMRYNAGYIRIKEMIEAGDFGTVLSVTHAKTRGYGLYGAGARHRAIVEPEESGGWTVHHACHDLDFLYWIAGPFKRVYAANATTVPDKDSEEVILGLVNFQSGAIGSIGDSVCGIRDHYTRIVGSAASLVMRGENEETFCRLRREGADKDEIIPIEDRKRPGNGLDHFFACIRDGVHSPNSLNDARPSLAAAIAMRESARTGLPVELTQE